MTALAQEIVVPEDVEIDYVDGLSQDEARALTDEVRQDVEGLWMKLLQLYEGGAHIALGYSSWSAYFEAEFSGSKAQAYRILNAGRVAQILDESPLGDQLRPRGLNERLARELAPLKGDPETVREAWAEVVDAHPEPTAADVRKVVQKETSAKKTTGPVRERPQEAEGDALQMIDLLVETAAAIAGYRAGLDDTTELSTATYKKLRVATLNLRDDLEAVASELIAHERVSIYRPSTTNQSPDVTGQEPSGAASDEHITS